MNFRKYPLPSNYFVVTFEEHKQIKNDLLECISNSNKMSIDKISELDYYIIKDKEPEYQKLFLKYFRKYIDKFVEPYKQFDCNGVYDITLAWFQRYFNNDTHGWHTHPECHFAFVYFLELPNSEYATEFISPHDGNSIIKVKDVKEGDVLIFPGTVFHRSPVYKEKDSIKTIIAFNIRLFPDDEEEDVNFTYN